MIIKFGISIGIIIAIIITSQTNIQGLFSSGSNIDKLGSGNSASKTLRLGYFPNVNHAQAIIGLKNGDFQKIIENNSDNSQNNLNIKEFVFSDGPSAIEALFGGQIDAAYVGPNPAISGYIASDKTGLQIVSGVSSGGAVFVVRNDSGIQSIKDLGGKKFASPQIGNTQDISLRKYLVKNGFNTVENGGNITIVTINPSDILTLMNKKQIDGAWVPEPWGARLIKDTDAKIFVDERSLWPNGKFVTTNIVVRTDYLKNNPDIIKKLIEANVDETLWINKQLNKTNSNDNLNEKSSKIMNVINAFNDGLKKITGKTIPKDILKEAFIRTDFTYDPLKHSLYKIADNANSLGFINNAKGSKLNITGIYDLTLLNKVLQEKGLKKIG
ncbi:MAG TPA: ABC transporter substrate-binding protein [Candidatus Nitrosocosmicus sp.]